MATSRDGFSLVIPAYNEAAGIRQAIVEADEALRSLGRPYEIVLVDDGSQDGTSDVVAASAANLPPFRLCAIPAIAAMALRTGFQAVRDDLVGFTDADCQFHLADLTGLLALAQGFPIVVGYRVGRQDPARRRLPLLGLQHAGGASSLGTGVRDCDWPSRCFTGMR